VLAQWVMTNRTFLRALVGVSLGVGAHVACSNYVPPDVPNYGPPNGLSGKAPDTPTGGGDDAGGGTTPEDAGGSTGATPLLCQTSGGTIVDGGACAVSFTTQIYPKMQAGGTWNCAGIVGCHGGSAIAPVLNGTTAQSFYDAMANMSFTYVTPAVPYVNPCSTSPTSSALACSVASTGTCGNLMPLGTAMPAADQTTIATWVACGAPFN